MSTRSTIKHDWDVKTQRGFHLFEDYINDCCGLDIVTLEITGALFEVSTAGRVAVHIPRPWARKLGLIRPLETPSPK